MSHRPLLAALMTLLAPVAATAACDPMQAVFAHARQSTVKPNSSTAGILFPVEATVTIHRRGDHPFPVDYAKGRLFLDKKNGIEVLAGTIQAFSSAPEPRFSGPANYALRLAVRVSGETEVQRLTGGKGLLGAVPLSFIPQCQPGPLLGIVRQNEIYAMSFRTLPKEAHVP